MTESSQQELEVYWAALQTRDREWDGRLFFGVKTTGIYCKPSCPAKRPQRKSVEFFSTANTAEQAGYRPCKRCQPDQWQNDVDEIARLIQIIQNRDDKMLTVNEWADSAGISPAVLRKLIIRFTGLTPRQLLMENKMNVFKKYLQNGETVSSSQFAAGFGSSSRLYEKAVPLMGMTPGKYKKGGEGVSIVYSLVDTPLGRLLIAATGQGVCSIKFGETDDDLVNDLKHEFPRAEIRPDSNELVPWIEQLSRYFSADHGIFDIPLDLHASTFQMLVWQELRKIPYGETRSYSQIANSIGNPKAVRAVASACAANPVAVVTPCHRIVHSDGTISGYRWGLDRKRALLNMEQKSKAE